MKHFLTLLLTLLITCGNVMAYDMNTYTAPEFWRHYGKQQIKTQDYKGNTVYITPDYVSYEDRNNHTSEKIVAIYDKHSPAYGYRYVIYTPIGKYIGHHKIMQKSPNGYGYDGIPDGDITGVSSKTPCFKSIEDAKRYYYPQYFTK